MAPKGNVAQSGQYPQRLSPRVPRGSPSSNLAAEKYSLVVSAPFRSASHPFHVLAIPEVRKTHVGRLGLPAVPIHLRGPRLWIPLLAQPIRSPKNPAPSRTGIGKTAR